MMRGPASWSVACRKADRSITVERFPLPRAQERYPWLKWPLARGCLVLGESLVIGIRALMVSASNALQAEAEEEQPTDRQLGWTLGAAMVLFSAVFIAVPVLATRLIGSLDHAVDSRPIYFNLVEGTVRIGLFVGYLLLIGRFEDIRRVFQYHGAEHKTIYAYENGDPLVPEHIDRKYPTLHVRCGTNFLFIVLFLTIAANFVVDVLSTGALGPRIGFRVLAIPVLAGLSYEVIKLASRNENSWFFRLSMLPGLALQKITTQPPSLDQIEVAIAAMEAVVPPDQAAPPPKAATGPALQTPDAPVA
jgi:uncharacterized protein YqhQ